MSGLCRALWRWRQAATPRRWRVGGASGEGHRASARGTKKKRRLVRGYRERLLGSGMLVAWGVAMSENLGELRGSAVSRAAGWGVGLWLGLAGVCLSGCEGSIEDSGASGGATGTGGATASGGSSVGGLGQSGGAPSGGGVGNGGASPSGGGGARAALAEPGCVGSPSKGDPVMRRFLSITTTQRQAAVSLRFMADAVGTRTGSRPTPSAKQPARSSRRARPVRSRDGSTLMGTPACPTRSAATLARAMMVKSPPARRLAAKKSALWGRARGRTARAAGRWTSAWSCVRAACRNAMTILSVMRGPASTGCAATCAVEEEADVQVRAGRAWRAKKKLVWLDNSSTGGHGSAPPLGTDPVAELRRGRGR